MLQSFLLKVKVFSLCSPPWRKIVCVWKGEENKTERHRAGEKHAGWQQRARFWWDNRCSSFHKPWPRQKRKRTSNRKRDAMKHKLQEGIEMWRQEVCKHFSCLLHIFLCKSSPYFEEGCLLCLYCVESRLVGCQTEEAAEMRVRALKFREDLNIQWISAVNPFICCRCSLIELGERVSQICFIWNWQKLNLIFFQSCFIFVLLILEKVGLWHWFILSSGVCCCNYRFNTIPATIRGEAIPSQHTLIQVKFVITKLLL